MLGYHVLANVNSGRIGRWVAVKDPGTKKLQNEKRNRMEAIRNLYGNKYASY